MARSYMWIEIQKVLERGGDIAQTLNLGPLEGEDGAPIESAPVALKGSIEKASGGFDFDASLAGGVTLVCVRCVESFLYPLSIDFHLLFAPSVEAPHAGEAQIQGADCDLYPCPGGKVDLAVVAREQIYLHMPLKPVCSESCKGLCLTCRENLNRGPCRCERPAAVKVV